MERQRDLVVIGAGPAGLAAACAAADCGLDVALVDEQAKPGGQLYRNIETPTVKALLEEKERNAGLKLVKDFYDSEVEYYPETTVWGVDARSVSCVMQGRPVKLTASCIVVASGAMERPVPFPGWTLPGVMSAGGADIVLRSGGVLCARADAPVILAGNGPLLLLLASHLVDAGVNIVAWLDTGALPQRLIGTGLTPAALLDSAYLVKGMKMAFKATRAKIPVMRNVTDIRAHATGDGLDAVLHKVSWQSGGKKQEKEACVLIRHEGVIPRAHILHSLNAEQRWDRVQRCWYTVTDEDGKTSIDGVYAVGDGAYVHGGDAAMLGGRLAGIAAAERLGVISAEEAKHRSAPTRRQLRKLRVARSFVRHIFAPHPVIYDTPDETLVCRCECVKAGDIRKAVSDGYHDVNEVKRFTRCGMGPCQGRMCGPALAEIIATARSLTPNQVGRLQSRQPLRPVSLQDYCDASIPGRL